MHNSAENRDIKGRLMYVVGPSGAGKDTLLIYARSHLERHPVVFAHRYITRPADNRSENHIALSEAEFDTRLAAGVFALHWQSHGYHYAVGVEIDLWLAQGLTVIVSGSRAAIDQAQQRYPQMLLIWVSAQADTLKERLHKRGRESATAIQNRLSRTERFPPPENDSIIMIDNDGPIGEGGQRLMDLILNS